MEILYLILGLVFGIFMTYLMLNRRLTKLRVMKGAADKELELLRQQHSMETNLRQRQFDEQLNVVREQFQNLAVKVLNSTSDELKSQNRTTMEQVTKPINESFTALQKAIVESDREQAKTAASLSEQLRQVSEQAQRMDKTASRLTNALRGDSKQAGDWGEMVLQELLDSQGFKRGYDYDVQDTITCEDGGVVRNEDTGRRMRPDVVLHYPGNQDVVIDAKVSIKAYYDYVNEGNELLKKTLLDRHVQSLLSHVKELAQKDYSRYIQSPRTAIDFVIMFVPNEAALQVALARDPKLWNEAFEKKVFISSTQNLFAILRMIQIAWRQHHQTENQKKIVGLAEQLVSRIGLFAERAVKLGRDIETLTADYADMQKSVDGTRGILQKANEMKKLGIKEDVKHPIPEVN
jgi:DNA recombination protein RmuC